MRVGAIDCGTNSIRLLIADVAGGPAGTGTAGAGPAAGDGAATLTDVVREMRVVRLGQGVDATGRLAADALERTFAAAEEYAGLLETYGAEKLRFVATSATRDAENRQDFVAGIRRRLGVDPEVISGTEEAGLSFAGATSVLAGAPGELVLVVDLGGGSTEFVVGDSAGVRAALSTDMGCVRFTERYLHTDPPTPAEIGAAEAEVLRQMAQAEAEVPLAGVSRVVGVAGTITTVTAHALRLASYRPDVIHGTELPAGVNFDACTELLQMSRSERAALPYMHPGRVDVIGAGALIWRTITARMGELTQGRVHSVTASEHDILDGIALSAAAS